MESATSVIKSVNGDKNGFINVVFSFNDDAKTEMFNMIQYTVLALIPSIIILKVVKNVAPEDDDSKGSFEITLEVLLQIVFMILAMYFTNKAIKYVPTYSGVNYVAGGDPTLILLPFVILLFAMQTKIGAKVNILYERLMELVHGKSDDASRVNVGKNGVRVSQPLAGQHNPSQADMLDMSQLLPNNTGLTTRMPGAARMQPQQSPDFNSMYNNQPTPMPGAAMPGYSEPIAANDFGGGFSNW